MEYRRLGKSGLQVSAISFGTWLTFGKQIDDQTARDLMVRAYDGGVNFFDNAETYALGKSEEVMGKILADVKWPRDTYVVSSKVFFGTRGYRPGQNIPNTVGLSRKHVVEACHDALRRLQVDYLDLYFCHRPDRETPIEETVRAMTELIHQGKILYWGTSEWTAWEIMEAYGVARQYNLIPPTMEQPQYNMLHRQKVDHDFVKLYQEIGLGTTIWSPLASGLLTGKYNDGMPDEDTRLKIEGLEWLSDMVLAEQRIEKARALAKIADGLGISMARLALAWCLKNPNVSTVITGASKIHHLEENLQAVDAVAQLDNEVMAAIEEILDNKPTSGLF
jgi:voltage-dependent potassium channel beta subunit